VEQTLGDAQVSLVPPSETFTNGGVTVHLGRREVRVLHLGRGNTAGDVVVHVPDARLVATGDLVVNPTPYGFGSYPAEWIETLRRLLALDAATLVPGHGPVEHDTSYIQSLIGLIEEVRSQVGAAVRDGATLEQTRKRVDLETWRHRFAGADATRDIDFRAAFVEPFVERAYQEAKGTMAEE
jgi:glyoxylase-like metal-dependent hydrolase (beta-lactamase superfamily II)